MLPTDRSTGPESPDDDGECSTPTPIRSLTFFHGLAIVIGLQIGSGIFSTPASVATLVPSPIFGVGIWALAGLLVWTGAASFAELGVRCPDNGGMQEYLRHCFGDLYGFLFAYTWIFVVRPCAMSMIALIFAEYLYRGFVPDDANRPLSLWILKGVALLAIGLVTYLNCLGTLKAVNTANLFLVLKIFTLGTIATSGLLVGSGALRHTMSAQSLEDNSTMTHNVSRNNSGDPSAPVLPTFSATTEAAFAALFAFGGWESIGFVAGEIQDPAENLPKILTRAMILVILLFVLTVTAFYIVLPLGVLQGTNAVATAFGAELFGRFGGIFYTWMVCLSCLGALNSTVFSAGRLTQAAAAQNFIPLFLLQTRDQQNAWKYTYSKGLFSRFSQLFHSCGLSMDHHVPVKAMLLNSLIATIFVLMGSFRGLLVFKGMTEYTVYFATVCGLLKVHLEPQSNHEVLGHGAYRTSIVNPLVFCGVAAFITIQSIMTHWLTALIICCMFIGGSVIFRSLWWQQLARRENVDAVS